MTERQQLSFTVSSKGMQSYNYDCICIQQFDNGDGQIDVEEFGMMINTHADAIFDLLDQNQDGLISIAEFKSDLDLNDDGTISKDEFMNDVEILASVLGLNLTLP